MTDGRDPEVMALLDRHTPDLDERSDWPRVLREAKTARPTPSRRFRHLRWIPTVVGAVGLAALIGALIIATPTGRETSAPPTAGTAKPITTVRAYLRDEATIAEVGHLRATLSRLLTDGRIASFQYESKSAALERLRSRLKNPSILDELPANPVPASFVVDLAPGIGRKGLARVLASEPAIDSGLGVR